MEPQYDIYFRGEVLEGFDSEAVRSNLARLFNANDTTLNKLFSGAPQAVKKNCDKATALKYKKAMEKAGAKPVVTQTQGNAESIEQPARQPAERQPSAAERIAALANAPDPGPYRTSLDEPNQTAELQADDQADQIEPIEAPQVSEPAEVEQLEKAEKKVEKDAGITLAPVGSDVLSEAERPQIEAVEIDVEDISVAPVGTRFSEPEPAPPPAPDVSHMSAADVGETIPTLPSDTQPLDPDISHIDLCPEGTDFSDCQVEVTPVDVDTDALKLEPTGSRLQEEKTEQASPPDTSHIQLDTD